MSKFVVIIPLALILFGCSAQTRKFLDQPQLTPVGAVAYDGLTTSAIDSSLEQDKSQDEGSSWVGGHADFFRDARPRRKGDLIIINIVVNDSATFNNSSAQSRKSANNAGTDFNVGLLGFVTQGKGDAKISGNAASSGQGSVVRSEKLKLQLTAVVRQVLPNGNFVVEGTQQVLVNNEMRDVRVAGIVNPNDIAPDNSIDYQKMAEARAQYGGTGNVSAVQKPAWGVQLWDKIMPF